MAGLCRLDLAYGHMFDTHALMEKNIVLMSLNASFCSVSCLFYLTLLFWQVYESWDSFKVNDILEVYGILSVDPVLSIVNNEER